jgi:hypothetical protein
VPGGHHEVLVDGAVAVVVHVVAAGVGGRRRAGLAAVDHRAVHALQETAGPAGPDAAARRRRYVVLVDGAVAVVVDAVARRVRRGRRPCLAGVDQIAVAAFYRAARRAGPDAAAGGRTRVVLVDGTVTVVVDTVAQRVGGSRRSGLAAVEEVARHALEGAVGRAGSHSTSRRRGDVLVVDDPVAVVVDAVADRVAGSGRLGLAGVDHLPGRAEGASGRRAGPDSAARGLGDVVLVQRAVAVVVAAVAELSGAGERGAIGVVAVAGIGGPGGGSAAGEGRQPRIPVAVAVEVGVPDLGIEGVVLVDAVVAVVVDPIADLGGRRMYGGVVIVAVDLAGEAVAIVVEPAQLVVHHVEPRCAFRDSLVGLGGSVSAS